MKTIISCRDALGLAALLGCTLLFTAPAQAQDAGAATAPAHNITLSFQNAPIQAVLRTLFSSAGIKNFIIDSDVRGYSNINVTDVPFGVALSALLRSVNPPLVYDVDNGLYHVKVQRAETTPVASVAIAPTVSPTAPPDNPGDTTKRFYRIPIDKYDAYYIAFLLGQQKGVIKVGANDVYGDELGSQSGQNGQSGNRSGFGGGGNRGGGFGGNQGGNRSGGGSGFGGGGNNGGQRSY